MATPSLIPKGPAAQASSELQGGIPVLGNNTGHYNAVTGPNPAAHAEVNSIVPDRASNPMIPPAAAVPGAPGPHPLGPTGTGAVPGAPGMLGPSAVTTSGNPLTGASTQDLANLRKQYIDIYGKGEGEALYLQAVNMGNQNSTYMQAYRNMMAPTNAMGRATLDQGMGSAGIGADSSTSAISKAIYESNIAGQEGMQTAQLLDQQRQGLLALTGGMATDARDEVSDSGGALGDILGGVEAAAGVAMEFVPGLQVPGAALIGGGISTIMGANSGGGKNQQGSAIPGAIQAIQQRNQSVNTVQNATQPNTLPLGTSSATPGVIPLSPIQPWGFPEMGGGDMPTMDNIPFI